MWCVQNQSSLECVKIKIARGTWKAGVSIVSHWPQQAQNMCLYRMSVFLSKLLIIFRTHKEIRVNENYNKPREGTNKNLLTGQVPKCTFFQLKNAMKSK